MSYKVLHIATNLKGGAGIAALRIHRALLEQGVESRMLVSELTKPEPEVYCTSITSGFNVSKRPKTKVGRLIKRCLVRLGFWQTNYEQIEREWKRLQATNPVFFSLPISRYDLAHHPLVEWADVIHLHWVQNFLDFETFFRDVNKPIVWTIHDLNPLMGGFHHIRYQKHLRSVYGKLEDTCYDIKKRALHSTVNVNAVAISTEMEQFIRQHEFFRSRVVFRAENVVGGDMFYLVDRVVARDLLGLPQDKKIVAFVNKDLNDSEKGLTDLIDAMEQVTINNVELLCVGEGIIPKTKVPVIHIKSMTNMEDLSRAYSAADVLVMPSYQESFGNTAVEALCCGTPVVMTKVGVADDLIDNELGAIATNHSPKALSEAIMCVLNTAYDRNSMRERVLSLYSPQRVAGEYMEIYEKVMNYK